MRTPAPSYPEIADPADAAGLERTYRELRERTECLARHLRAIGVVDSPVAKALEPQAAHS